MLGQKVVRRFVLPRMRIIHTSAQEGGQIYMPAVNWLLLAVVLAATIGFGSSSALASAWSAFNEKQGVKMTYLTAGRYKAEGNPDEPLSPEARAYDLSRINDYYSAFTQAVARGRRNRAQAQPADRRHDERHRVCVRCRRGRP